MGLARRESLIILRIAQNPSNSANGSSPWVFEIQSQVLEPKILVRRSIELES
jgi:hypothetical protein